MKYAIVVWATSDLSSPGVVYGWYESLATAVKTATNLTQTGFMFPGRQAFFKATVVKAL